MELEIKRPDRIVPEYSLTGDLLSFRTCAMQYRYYNGSSLPPSRPVQMWYGEFIHGVLETAYRLWTEGRTDFPFPWPYMEIGQNSLPAPPPAGLARNDLRQFAWPVEQALIQQGKRARSGEARNAAYRRANVAINMLGPHLFGLISAAEQKVIGTRMLPPRQSGVQFRSDKYVLTGVIDVLTNVELNDVEDDNIIRRAINTACPGLTGNYEVVVDYKGSHRPSADDEHWQVGEWQLQTYAWLRQRQPDAPRVGAGILIYINELSPGSTDVARLRDQIRCNSTDVVPQKGDPDDYAIRAWVAQSKLKLSEAFRFRRALRVIPIDQDSIQRATSTFDKTVGQIESRVVDEADCGSIAQTWKPEGSRDEQTCAACDFRPFCPSPARGSDSADRQGLDLP